MSATAMPPSMTPEQAAAMAAAMAAAAKEIARIGAINKAYFAAIMGVTVWDWFIQLNAEYRHIWKASNTFMKFAYIFCRYWNFGVNILCLLAFHANWTQAKCDHVVRIQAAVSVVTVCSAAMLLLLRARAVWSQSWYITCLLGALLVAEFSVMMVVGQVWGTAVPILTESGKGNCFPSADSRVFLLYWSAPIVFDATATILMLVKSWETYRLGSTVAKVFLRDGLAYFVVISALNILNIGFWAQSNASIQGVNSALALSLSSIFACRMVLSLKRQSEVSPNRPLITSNSTHKLGSTKSSAAPTYLSFTHTQEQTIDTEKQSLPDRNNQAINDLSYVSVH